MAGHPKVDATDFYMFRSYEAGRGAYVTLLANYIPFQDPQGGPNFYKFNPNALYEIPIHTTRPRPGGPPFQFTPPSPPNHRVPRLLKRPLLPAMTQHPLPTPKWRPPPRRNRLRRLPAQAVARLRGSRQGSTAIRRLFRWSLPS